MKRIMLVALALVLALSSVACGDGAGIGSSGNRARSASDFVAAFKEEGYTVEGDTSEMDSNIQKWIKGATSISVHGFYRLKVSEEGGWFVFMTFSNTDEAEEALNDIVKMYTGDGQTFKRSSSKNGEKAFYRDSLDSKFGTAIYVSQVKETVLLLATGWDIDTDGKYENTPDKILEKLGY